jgi:beta-glucosidase
VEGYNWLSILDGLKNRFGNQVTYSENPTKEELEQSDVVLVSIGTRDTEGSDRPFDLPADMNKKVMDIADVNPNTIVIVNSGGGVNMSQWNEKVAAILYSWYPGQMGNQALSEILAGDVNPSGKLPITIEKKFEDSPGYPYLPSGEKLYTGWDIDSQMDTPVYDVIYKESFLVGYRWYDFKNIEPLYPFGYGLSYTTFDYSGLKLSAKQMKNSDMLKVSFILENSGDVEGSEIAQLYIEDEKSTQPRPVKELKDFIRVNLKAGEKVKVEFAIDKQDLSYYNEAATGWVAEPGAFNVLIGTSSKDILLKDKFELVK